MLRRAALVACGCWGLAGTVYVVDLRQDHRALAGELAVLEPSIAELLAVRQQATEVADMVRVVQRDAENTGRVLSVMQAVTLALPDSSFLLRLHISTDGSYEVSGLGIDPGLVGREIVRALGRGESREVTPGTLGDSELAGWRGFHVTAARNVEVVP